MSKTGIIFQANRYSQGERKRNNGKWKALDKATGRICCGGVIRAMGLRKPIRSKRRETRCFNYWLAGVVAADCTLVAQ
jgi:hypothetical protein